MGRRTRIYGKVQEVCNSRISEVRQMGMVEFRTLRATEREKYGHVLCVLVSGGFGKPVRVYCMLKTCHECFSILDTWGDERKRQNAMH